MSATLLYLCEQLVNARSTRLPAFLIDRVGHVGGGHAAAEIENDHNIAADDNTRLASFTPAWPGDGQDQRCKPSKQQQARMPPAAGAKRRQSRDGLRTAEFRQSRPASSRRNDRQYAEDRQQYQKVKRHRTGEW